MEKGVYKLFSLSFSPEEIFTHVIIGPFCNSRTNTPNCSDYASNVVYFNLDYVSLVKEQPLYQLPLSEVGETIYHSNAFELYPNPNNGHMMLSFPKSNTSAYLLRVNNLLGFPLLEKYMMVGKEHRDIPLILNYFPGGMYVVELLSPDGLSLFSTQWIKY